MQTITEWLWVTVGNPGPILSGAPDDLTITLNGVGASIHVGNSGRGGTVNVCDANGKETIKLEGETGNLVLGGNGQDGDVIANDANGNETVRISAGEATLLLGGNGQTGDLFVRNASGKDTIHLEGETGNLVLGGNGVDGDVIATDKYGNETVRISAGEANLLLGDNGYHGYLHVYDSSGKLTIKLDGGTGDIQLSGGDCAEYFDMAEDTQIEPGQVLVVGESGELEPCSRAYDRRVVGVASGAGAHKPGLILDSSRERGRALIALIGKVFCQVDASEAPIEVGDMLTTSARRGFAMKAVDPARAFGAVLGKALGGLTSGEGTIPVLVTLQ